MSLSYWCTCRLQCTFLYVVQYTIHIHVRVVCFVKLRLIELSLTMHFGNEYIVTFYIGLCV